MKERRLLFTCLMEALQVEICAWKGRPVVKLAIELDHGEASSSEASESYGVVPGTPGQDESLGCLGKECGAQDPVTIFWSMAMG